MNFQVLDKIDPDINHFDQVGDFNMCAYCDVNEFISNKIKIKGGFSVLNFNIRSFFKNYDEFFSVLTNCNIDIDVITLSETWLHKDTQKLCNIPGYKSFHSYRLNKEGGGVSIFIREFIETESLNLNTNDDNIECVGIKLLNSNNVTNILGIYRPPSGDVSVFLDKLEELIENYNLTKNDSIIMGDFNICLLKEINDNLNGLNNMMSRYYFSPMINKPTRVTKTTLSIIDHIWVNFVCKSNSKIIISDITDHYICVSNFDRLNDDKNELIKLKFRDLSGKNKNNFINSVNNVDWNLVLGASCNPEDKTNALLDKLESLYNTCFPVKTKFIGKKRLNNPWLSDCILNSIRLKHFKYKQFINGHLSKFSYKMYCKILSKIIRSSKKIYYNNLFTKHKNDMKSTWNMINKILNSKYKPCKYIEIQLDNKLLNSDEVPDAFNKYFVNLGPNLKNKFNSSNNFFTNFLPDPLNSSVFLRPTNIEEVEKVILSLKSTKNTISKIGSGTLKLVHSTLSLPISQIFNSIIETGIYPSKLKTACVIPVFKSGSRKDIENYRPISTLNCVNIVIEKLLFIRINSFLNKYNVLIDTQYGFRKGRTTSDAVVRLLQGAYESINDRSYFGVVSLDLSKAFDTVDHGVLLHKIYNYSIRGVAHKIFASYLSHRNQYVFVNGATSCNLPVTVGVPQGSVLGPLLFLLYINDMPKSISTDCNMLLYADDSLLFSSNKNIYELCAKLNASLRCLYMWLNSNFLTLNIK